MNFLPREPWGAVDWQATVDVYLLIPFTVLGALAGLYFIAMWMAYEIGVLIPIIR